MAYILHTNETHNHPTIATAIANFFKRMGALIVKAQIARAERYVAQMKL